MLRLPRVSQERWLELTADEEVQREVLLQKAAHQRRSAMQGIDSGNVDGCHAELKV